jgi:hypothetical protein
MSAIRKAILLACLGAIGQPCGAVPLYLSLFRSSRDRAVAGLARQQARERLARAEYERARRLSVSSAISPEEVDQLYTADIAAHYDFEIASIRAKQATISYQLAEVLARRGRRLPLCVRGPQTDEDTVTALLKRKRKAKPVVTLIGPADGTQLQLPDASASGPDSPPPAPSAPDASGAPDPGGPAPASNSAGTGADADGGPASPSGPSTGAPSGNGRPNSGTGTQSGSNPNANSGKPPSKGTATATAKTATK